MDELPHLAIIVEGEPDRAVARWLAEAARRRGDLEVDLLDLSLLHLVDACEVACERTPPAVHDLAPWLAVAAGFVVVVPRRFPVALAHTVGWCPDPWSGKPVAFACDTAEPAALPGLRVVFAAVRAVLVREVAVHPDPRRADRVLATLTHHL
ncbi:NAD(P)H-dependent oxidoreductase [Saccharothrix sp. NPDC042600]|uniref:NAD(P)H-dependent oxidoreductase n=1 Tax=Saccharothrix TaxID=2071 RepID=UPI0033EDF073|nr:hypothetical protein GCM10017745_18700 [Saccharothrix mutabilis subsp. capreolus]